MLGDDHRHASSACAATVAFFFDDGRNRQASSTFVSLRRADCRSDVDVARPATGSTKAVMLSDRLKIETRSAHDRIERTLDLMRPDLSRAHYVALLLRFQAFFRVWEPHVAQVLADDVFFNPRRRLHWLDADLRFFGVRPLDEAAPIPTILTAHQAMGSLYVLEGSTLGGLVIARHVKRTLGFEGQGALYFSNRGEAALERWRAFKERLNQFGAPATDPVVIQAANETFAVLDLWLGLARCQGGGRPAQAAEAPHG